MSEPMLIQEAGAAIERALHEHLEERRAALSEAAELIDEIARVVNAGGKRLRPLFCYHGFVAAGGDPGPPIARSSASLELLHTFALIHDDIMDASHERRGVPTTYAAHGTAAAILAGDLALVLADSLFATAGFDAATTARAHMHYARMRQEVIAGQFQDLAAADDPDITSERAREIALLKSGLYSVAEPLVIGAALAGASDAILGGLHSYGSLVGEAFQLRDDLLGCFGDESVLGKPVDSDIREGKHHTLYALARDSLGPEDRAVFVSRWGAPDLDGSDIERLRGLLVASGAGERTESLIRELAEAATAELGTMPISDESFAALTALMTSAVDRQM